MPRVPAATRPTDIIWLASYPKSGNTWLRFLLIHLIHGPQSGTGRFEQLLPDIHVGLDNYAPHPPHLLKTHFTLRDDMPHRAQTKGFIYILRDPIDVLASSLNYCMRALGPKLPPPDSPERQAAIDRYVDRFLDLTGDPTWLQRGYGSWPHHVDSWLGAESVPHILVRYDALEADAQTQVARVCAFLELERSADEIAAAVAACGFDQLRDIERREMANGDKGFFYKPEFDESFQLGLRFMQHGASGHGKAVLSADQWARAADIFAPYRERFGFA